MFLRGSKTVSSVNDLIIKERCSVEGHVWVSPSFMYKVYDVVNGVDVSSDANITASYPKQGLLRLIISPLSNLRTSPRRGVADRMEPRPERYVVDMIIVDGDASWDLSTPLKVGE